MYDRRDKNIISQINSSTKYISNTYRGVMQNEIYCHQITKNINSRACVRMFNR